MPEGCASRTPCFHNGPTRTPSPHRKHSQRAVREKIRYKNVRLAGARGKREAPRLCGPAERPRSLSMRGVGGGDKHLGDAAD